MTDEKLFGLAMEAAKGAYAPYSRFRVGAALLLSDGKVLTGVNVENRSYGLTICAERSAVAVALSAGRKDFSALALATPDAEGPAGRSSPNSPRPGCPSPTEPGSARR